MAPQTMTRIARGHTGRAIEVLAQALDDGDMRIALAAARELLDRGWGKPGTISADASGRLAGVDDDTLDAAIEALKTAVEEEG